MNAEQTLKPAIAKVDPPKLRERLEVGTGSERQEHCTAHSRRDIGTGTYRRGKLWQRSLSDLTAKAFRLNQSECVVISAVVASGSDAMVVHGGNSK